MVKKIFLRVWALLVFLGFGSPAAGAEPVKAWKDTLTIPTYLTGEPQRLPFFYFGRAYQGAKGPVYPYPMLDALGDTRTDKAYTALFLENEFVQYCVLPELGGRIFSALDRVNGYDFIYRQHVIKPALIGMLGAWISGGVEWNIPHHHRATTFLPVDATLTDHPDGSKTIWVGELELRHRMRWEVGLTLAPGRSVLEVTIRIINRTPLAQSLLCWANAAVPANRDYQVIFPPGTRVATFHGKNQFSHWPLSTEIYNGVDYRPGTDVSWWKNNPSPTSFFAWNSEEDFLAGYDHGRQAGVVFAADHNLVPGKKFWTWGTGSEGALWEKILTDADGPYLELMFGAFSDNQPDYSWCRPYEVKTVKEFWYPVRMLGGVKAANDRAALNVEQLGGGRVRVSLNVTAPLKAAVLAVRDRGRLLLREVGDFAPASTFRREITAGPDAARHIEVSLEDAQGRQILRYESPPEGGEEALPQPVAPPAAPQNIKTVEELYLTGQRLEQFYNPVFEPEPYYQEALRRDPDESRVNTALGLGRFRRGLYREAERYFERSAARVERDYTRPRDAEALYYLGLALRAQGRGDEAQEMFYRATWDEAWKAQGYYQLAEMACGQGSWDKALEYLQRSLSANSSNAKALNLNAVLLDKLGRTEEARILAEALKADDPLDPWPLYTLWTIAEHSGRTDAEAFLQPLTALLGTFPQNSLELASDYAGCGLWPEAAEILSLYRSRIGEGRSVNPMVDYALGYYSGKMGKVDEERRWDASAAALPPDYCFPFRLEEVEILRRAQAVNPGDGRAAYYLGNLVFDLQPEEALKEWEKSVALGDTSALALRNLGLAYARVKNDLPAAVRCLEKALALDKNDVRLFYELDQYYEMAGLDPEKRLALLEANEAVVLKRDDALSREIGLLVQLGKLDKALTLLRSHHFHVWEGGGEIHGLYVEACFERGQDHFAAGRHRQALADFAAALDYPRNLEVAKPSRGGLDPRIHYSLGKTYAALGDSARAKEQFRLAAESPQALTEAGYYQGLAWRRLGQEEKARDLFAALEVRAREDLASGGASDFFAKFGEKQSRLKVEARANYLLGLALNGLGKKAEAEAAVRQALSLDPGLYQASCFLTRPQSRE